MATGYQISAVKLTRVQKKYGIYYTNLFLTNIHGKQPITGLKDSGATDLTAVSPKGTDIIGASSYRPKTRGRETHAPGIAHYFGKPIFF